MADETLYQDGSVSGPIGEAGLRDLQRLNELCKKMTGRDLNGK